MIANAGIHATPDGAFAALSGSKEIAKAKLLVTTRCNLGCPYCFVKDTGEDMSWDLATRAVDLLTASRGCEKLISLFGGEPLLNFELIERLLPYAQESAERNGKALTLSMITSGALLTPERLRTLARHRVHMAVSLAGEAGDNDALRFFHGGRGSHAAVVEKVARAFEAMEPELLGVSFCVFPRSAARLVANFDYLLSIGFRYFNFEIVLDHDPWTYEHAMTFLEGCETIFRRCMASVESRDPIHLNSVSWELARGRATKERDAICPFNYELKVYPGGEMVFSHSTMNVPARADYVIGDLMADRLSRYATCVFDRAADGCRSCVKDYFKGFPQDKGAELAHRVVDRLTAPAVRFLSERAPQDARYARYIESARRGLF